jgi:hypothetical protein
VEYSRRSRVVRRRRHEALCFAADNTVFARRGPIAEHGISWMPRIVELQIALKCSDFREGVASSMEKRLPRFTGRGTDRARRRPSGYGVAAFATIGLAEPKQAQPAKAGGARRDRTADLVIANDALSQLSYGPFAAGSC